MLSSVYTCYMPSLSHPLLLDYLIMFDEDYISRSYPVCIFLHPSITSFLFRRNIPLNTVFSFTLSLCSSLNVRDQVSHPYRTTGKITVLNIQIFKSSAADEKTGGSGLNGSKHYHNSISYFSHESNFELLLSFPNIRTVAHFQTICLLFLCRDYNRILVTKKQNTLIFSYVYF
jgi:hypothetical protein